MMVRCKYCDREIMKTPAGWRLSVGTTSGFVFLCKAKRYDLNHVPYPDHEIFNKLVDSYYQNS